MVIRVVIKVVAEVFQLYLTHFMPLVLSIPPENMRKAEVF